MEITVNVNVKAPEVVEAITALVVAMGSTKSVVAELGRDAGAKQTTSKGDKPKEQNTKPPKETKEETKNEEQPKVDEEGQSEEKITLEQVRAKLAELTRAGKPIKQLITKFGASKLSEIPAEKYAEVLKEAEGL
ncbi:hypothetical protein [Ruminiclostridium cellulolyticum]|uniref:rRNA biogenesis protein rrp5 n=1 Tax=Ruminiclostridium cellulolyticum (strain ATCC 35319 / DSM 5812 / JCM 6584 / H10) TaxID=394503 RepID=B8I927_RUMCH|nr:hypothetical protein [Ruminiclostridium cellulolyticum]ACL77359.1 conserved hypothetical protein [Ruminiclostridium cellulolyticum H10]